MTTSAWEHEQKRQVSETLRFFQRADLGECAWTGKVDNTDLGLVHVGHEPVCEDDFYEWEAQEW